MTKTNVARGRPEDSSTAESSPAEPGRRRAIGTNKSVAALAACPAMTGRVTKRDQLAALLVRDDGATLEQMIAITGWLPHTTRAALTGLRKSGYVMDSDKIDGVRTYRAVAPK